MTARPQYTHLPAALRVLIDKDTPINTLFMPYDKIFDKFPGELKIASVSSIDENKTLQGGRVILKTGEQITYDILAVATGSSWQGFISFPSEQALYEEHIQLWRNKFAKAEDIVIVGGGAVGIGKSMILFYLRRLTVFSRDCWRDKRRISSESFPIFPSHYLNMNHSKNQSPLFIVRNIS